jgi:hypothetical protein
MPNVTATQILLDGDKHVVVLCTGILDTSNVSATVVIDVSALGPPATDLLIDYIYWSASAQLQVLLSWEAATDDLAAALVGSAHHDYKCFGGLKNPRSAGWNGDLVLSTQGWASGIQTYSVIIHASKRGA